MAMSSAGGGSETSVLITRIAAGDRDAFSRFYDLLAPAAFGLIRRVLRDPDAAAEVLQGVFWQVWSEASRYDPERGSPETWLIVRAKTRAVDRRRAALRDCESTLADLAGAAPEPPPAAVKAALMERIAAVPVSRALARRRRAIWPVALSGAMAAAGLAAIVVGWSVSSTYEKRLDALAHEADQLEEELRTQQAILAILRDPATQVVALAGQAPAPAARARMLWREKAGGLLVATGLPETPTGKTYQLWAIAGGNAPVSAGVFGVDAGGAGSLTVRPLPGVTSVTTFVVTLEPAGGLPAPSGATYLLGGS
jgi:DNA-directed RNA polymerase specialized sigma24 family protein